ncbi:MAG: type II toxin-antitoxin system CcdA family antitoxin [Alphaproteobacteria bacterium]|nr:type II toxin-antitoxin system CcdA family antitoxin [Alphaproteobacteria bacterium]
MDRPRRRPVNLTLPEDLLSEAKSLNVNASREAEAGIRLAVKKAREEKWLKHNRAAIDAHNKRVEKSGPLLTSSWAED